MGITAMTSAIPQYNEVRITLTEIDSLFHEYIVGSSVIDIGETLRVMLGDYFYGEPLAPALHANYHTEQDRTIVFRQGNTLQGIDLVNAIDLLGDIFWALADTITHKALQVNAEYTHRPNSCFYKFFPTTRELVIYTPVLSLSGYGYSSQSAPLDGIAVITVCNETLPSWFRNVMPPLLKRS